MRGHDASWLVIESARLDWERAEDKIVALKDYMRKSGRSYYEECPD